jgi:uncharacterized protein (DUF1800 family)
MFWSSFLKQSGLIFSGIKAERAGRISTGNQSMAGFDETFRIGMQRFGHGARPESRASLGKDIKAAVLAEIDPARIRLSRPDLPSTARGIQLVAEADERRREARAAAARQTAAAPPAPDNPMMAAPPPAGDKPAAEAPKTPPPPLDPAETRLREVIPAEARARIEQAMAAGIGFGERWVDFWSNHFCVALRRGQILQGIVGAYEREVIRAHAFGTFSDMLLAAEMHPAMLHFLDQRQSIGPASPAGQRQKKGLNENLAREIMELHTLGVGGGYTQTDVTTFAKVLTGWSISGNEENLDGYGGFFFAPNRHEPGPQVILGKTYAQEGKEQGIAVLRDLAAHPSTAKFVARKIARHFVADNPPAALVEKLQQDFRKTGGNLASLARTLVSAAEAWALPQTKLRTPYDFVLASLRATGEKPDKVPQLLNALNLMGQQLWNPPGPNGYPDDEAGLIAPKAIKTRLEFSVQIARQIAGRIDPRELADQLYGTALGPETRQAIARAETRPQGMSILLMSPEFQWR